VSLTGNKYGDQQLRILRILVVSTTGQGPLVARVECSLDLHFDMSEGEGLPEIVRARSRGTDREAFVAGCGTEEIVIACTFQRACCAGQSDT